MATKKRVVSAAQKARRGSAKKRQRAARNTREKRAIERAASIHCQNLLTAHGMAGIAGALTAAAAGIPRWRKALVDAGREMATGLDAEL